jgi:signal peptidase I
LADYKLREEFFIFFAWIACGVFSTNHLLMPWCNTDTLILVSLSGEIKSARRRGDALFINNSTSRIAIGDLIAFRPYRRNISTVQRIIQVHQDRDAGKDQVVTKGDDNRVDDRGLYAAPGQLWLEQAAISGNMVGIIPVA